MNRCPITYEECGDKLYSRKGLNLLSRNLGELKTFSYTQAEQLIEAGKHADKLSIQGVQPKLSTVLSIKEQTFKIVDRNGSYIIKPQLSAYPHVPENEDLTMKLASLWKIEVPLHGLIYSKDRSFSYFIKRFDRFGKNDRIPVEDFAQLSGATRDTKYNSSMEKVADVVNHYCTFPLPEKVRLFRLVLFNFLTGNEDNHLKNYSVITKDNVTRLSPAYDLLNTTIITDSKEETALPIGGKKKGITKKLLIDYYATERLKINSVVIDNILSELREVIPKWTDLIERSFLPSNLKERYMELVLGRSEILLK